MSRKEPVAIETILAGVVAGVVAVLGALVLAATAKPQDFKARLAALEADTAEAAQLTGRNGMAAPAGAVCGSADDAEGARLQAQLVRVAQQTGLQNPTVEVRNAGPAGSKAKLGALTVKLEATGGYDSALRLLEQMGGLRPTIFIDTFDITSKTTAVSVAVEGRAFCSVL